MAERELLGDGGLLVPGLIVRHTSRRLGRLTIPEACEGVISGKISFSEFVDQVGDEFRLLLEFMTEHDLHPGRPDEVLYCADCYAGLGERRAIREQLSELYRAGFAGSREAS